MTYTAMQQITRRWCFGVLFTLGLMSSIGVYPRMLLSQAPPALCPVATATDDAVAKQPKEGTFHGRLADPRINFGTTDDGKYICRWALERREPHAAVSDVINPILYLVQVPQPWTPTIIQAIQAWLPVFDAIGFRHALTARVMRPQDSVTPPVNSVVIRIDSSETQGGGTSCTAHSTRGDLASCTITINHGMLGVAAKRLCEMEAGGDPTIPLPCPDSMLRFLLAGVVTHEVGHSLGLMHNYFAGRAYPTDSLRSVTFVRRWGFTPSIMYHGAYNEVVQPDDHMPYAARWLQIGPQDYWAIAWGYRPIPQAAVPEAEQPTLEQWRHAQDTASYLRLSVADSLDAGDVSWGGDDPLRAMDLWTRNMGRLWRRLATWSSSGASVHLDTATRRDDQADIVQFWQMRLWQVTRLIGSRVAQSPYPRQASELRLIPVPTALQLQAMRFVLGAALYGQDSLVQQQPHFASAGDSVPIVFDASIASQSVITQRWQQAQFDALSHLVDRVPSLPFSARPEACRYLTAASAHLARAESQGTPEQHSSLIQLHDVIRDAFQKSGVCH